MTAIVAICSKLAGSSTVPRKRTPRITAASFLGSGMATSLVSVFLPMSGHMKVATQVFPRWSSMRTLRRVENGDSVPIIYSVLPSAKSISVASKSESKFFSFIDYLVLKNRCMITSVLPLTDGLVAISYIPWWPLISPLNRYMTLSLLRLGTSFSQKPGVTFL